MTKTKSMDAAANLPPDSNEVVLDALALQTPENCGKAVIVGVRNVNRHTTGLMANFQGLGLVVSTADISSGHATKAVHEKGFTADPQTGKLQRVPTKLIPGNTTLLN